MLEPPTKGDERRPGVVNVPIQVTISPLGAVLQENISLTVTVIGGNATGKKMSQCKVTLATMPCAVSCTCRV